jgi:hypothetical protein
MFVIPGPSREDRRFYFQRYLSPKWERFRVGTVEDVYGPHTTHWLDVGVIEDATARLSEASIPADCRDVLPVWCPPRKGVWELLWGLIGVEDLVIQEPLATMVDQQGFLAHDLYRLLWEARFRVKENSVNLTPAQEVFDAALLWAGGKPLSEAQEKLIATVGVTTKVETTAQQAEMLCMVMTLAAQNSLVNRIVLTFDSLERALEHPQRQKLLRGLNHFVDAVERWIKVPGGCPVGVLVGFADTARNRALLREHHPKLASRVEDGLAWTAENDA